MILKINSLRLFLLLLLSLTMRSVIAQDLNIMEVPKQFKPPTAEILTISLQDVMNSGLGTTGEYWDVISIKEDVPCYMLSNGTTKIHTLSFLQRLYVNGVEGNFIHVYKPLKEFVLTNNDVEDYGWVNKDDLLLWRHSVVTDERKKIDIKCIILNTIDSIHKKNEEVNINGKVKNDIVPFYLDPTLKKKSGEYSQLFNILYVYDTYPPNSPLEESTSVLLGQSDAIIDVSSIKSNIKGWVPTNRITFWKNRIAVEINSDKEAVEERKRNNTPVLVFASNEKGKKLAKKYGELNIPANKVKPYTYKGNFEDERKLGTWMRFPVLKDIKSENLLELIVIDTINDSTEKKEGFVCSTGIAPQNIVGLKYPLFKRNLFLSITELIQIRNDIHKISQARSNDKRRDAVVDAWIGLLNNYYENQNESDLKKMKIGEIQTKVFGISSNSDIVFCKYSLQDILDSAKVSNTELLQYLNYMEKKYSFLRRITNSWYYRYQFFIDKKSYYWISEDYLP